MKTIQTLAALAAICFFSGCSATIITRNNQAKITIPEGAEGQYPQAGQTVEWSGEKNAQGFANGPGTETWFGVDGNKVREVNLTYQNGTKNGPFTFRQFANGKLQFEETGTYANNIHVGVYKKRIFQTSSPDDYVSIDECRTPSGYYHGERVMRKLNGERTVEQWHLGNIHTSTTYNRDGSVKAAPVSQQTASSNSSDDDDDDDILGAVLGITGAAAGNADLTMSGVSLMAGDKQGAMQHVQNFATSKPGSKGWEAPMAFTGANPNQSISSKSRANAGRNLVDKYGLGGSRNKQDHITHYIAAADEAFARYKQTGNSAYYDQHREYADLANEFHKRTKTEGTRLVR